MWAMRKERAERVNISLTPSTLKLLDVQARAMGLQRSTYIGMMVRHLAQTVDMAQRSLFDEKQRTKKNAG
jgi:uncharacterized protein (DUF305 family)